ncbi:hypothetical protein Q7P35_008193 [Cladosporium inversicolor]
MARQHSQVVYISARPRRKRWASDTGEVRKMMRGLGWASQGDSRRARQGCDAGMPRARLACGTTEAVRYTAPSALQRVDHAPPYFAEVITETSNERTFDTERRPWCIAVAEATQRARAVREHTVSR